MAWTTTTWSNYDWSQASILNEFVDAINERCHNDLESAVSIGYDVQLATLWAGWQDRIENLISGATGDTNPDGFAVSHASGVKRSTTYYDGRSTIDIYTSLADAFSAAGLAHSNWRRYTTHPDDGGTAAYGQCQSGDIIGPWLMEDLQKILNVLIWQRYPFDTVVNNGWEQSGSATIFQSTGSSSDQATYAALQTHLSSEWAADSPGTNLTGTPRMTISVTHDPVDDDYSGRLRWYTNEAVVRVLNGLPSQNLNCDIDWYIYATQDTLDYFDAQGADVTEDTFEKWLTDSAVTFTANTGTNSQYSSDWFGGDNTPDEPTNYPPTPASETLTKGWTAPASIQKAIVRWDVAGGFQFT